MLVALLYTASLRALLRRQMAHISYSTQGIMHAAAWGLGILYACACAGSCALQTPAALQGWLFFICLSAAVLVLCIWVFVLASMRAKGVAGGQTVSRSTSFSAAVWDLWCVKEEWLCPPAGLSTCLGFGKLPATVAKGSLHHQLPSVEVTSEGLTVFLMGFKASWVLILPLGPAWLRPYKWVKLRHIQPVWLLPAA